MNWLIRWIRGLFHRGYWVCPDDWQGQGYDECVWHPGPPPVKGVSVYYLSPTGLKPYSRSMT